MKKTIIRLALCLIGLLPTMPISADTWENHREALDYEGKGSLIDPIVISTPGQLAEFSHMVNEGRHPDGMVAVLANDIDLTATDGDQRRSWVPIGTMANPYRGLFLGFNPNEEGWEKREPHAIRGLYCSSGSDLSGLFGVSSGFIGFLNVIDAEINNPDGISGIVCGINNSSSSITCYEDVSTFRFFTIPNAIYSVRTEGKINASNALSNTYLGGMVGDNQGFVVHSTAKVIVGNGSQNYVGGIAGCNSGTIFDCAADVDLHANVLSLSMGGIAGVMKSGIVEACASTGSITDRVIHTGGIVGLMEQQSFVRGCVTTAHIESWGGATGGIAGTMRPGSNYQEGNPTESKIESCVFAGNITGETSPVGGICGSMQWTNKEERIVNTLVIGTSTASKAYNGILGDCKAEPVQALSNSYWDKTLFAGTNITSGEGDNPRMPTTVKALITEKLISGKLTDAPLLDTDDEADFYFKFQTGYYPRLVVNKQWDGYERIKANTSISDVTLQLFGVDNIYRDNTVVLPTFWLAAVPVIIPKGDATWDFVSSAAHKEKTVRWNEDQRDVSLKSTINFPRNSSIIRVKDNTAHAFSNGTFTATMSFDPTKKIDAICSRPQPMIPTKPIFFNATPDQIWDGSTATEYAAGSGLAEDPYIIRNGAQLVLALNNNEEGQWFKQLCDITLNPAYTDNIPQGMGNFKVCIKPANGWKGVYNGDGHYIIRPYLSNVSDKQSLFGDVSSTGQIYGLGLVGGFCSRLGSALLASNVDGKIYDCIVQGVLTPAVSQHSDFHINGSGGICTSVGKNNPEAVVEDCIGAVYCTKIFSDFNPLVCLNDQSKGTVRNCLVTAPVYYGDQDYNNEGLTAAGKSYIKDCYWLKGCENTREGHTLEEITAALGNRERWQASENYYFPMLKTFAESDMGQLLMLPVRTDLEDATYANSLLDVRQHLLFEPGGATWGRSTVNYNYFEADTEIGVVSPILTSVPPQHTSSNPRSRDIVGVHYLIPQQGKFVNLIPLRTSSEFVNPGITFVDQNALQACLEAFNTDHDAQHLSLMELSAVTNEQTLTAFQTATARDIVRFPEFRLFKSVTKLTTQLNNLNKLEEVRLPYTLKTIASDAFSGCTKLKSVTVPAKVTNVNPHPFYGSGIENVYVDRFNADFKSRDGMLFDVNNTLISYPNGRPASEEITISGDVNRIEEGAIYKLPILKRLYLDLDDYNRIVPELAEGGIETVDGNLIDVYVKDGTFDQQVYDEMLNDYSWEEYAEDNRLHRYYPLKIDETLTGSFYIGFDTKLSEELTPYIATQMRPILNAVFLQEMSREVPLGSPVVVFASQPGVYHLMPNVEPLEQWKMYENRLSAVGIDGMPVYQEDASEGNIYTLQRGEDGKPGFYLHREEMVPPFHACLKYNNLDYDLGPNVFFGLAFLVSDNSDFKYWGCYDGHAILSGYSGAGGKNLVIPETITAFFDGEQQEFQVTDMDEAWLKDAKVDVWSIDFTKNSLLKNVKVDRADQRNPFYHMDQRTIIYLPEGQGFTAAEGEQNVVIGTECQQLNLTDGWGFQPPYDFTTEKATYDRVFSAVDNGDGTWTSKAYSVCLPYPVYLDMEEVLDKGLAIYELWNINEQTGQFIFSNATPNHLLAGHSYVLVVKNGSVLLNSDKSKLPDWVQADLEVKANPYDNGEVHFSTDNANENIDPAGLWAGTFMPMSNADCRAKKTYIIQKDGYFRRVTNNTVNITSFRAFFQPEKSLKRNGYKMVFDYHEEGEDDDIIIDFPSEGYESDGDMPPYDDEVTVGIVPIVHDFHPAFEGEDAYYDLQGRRLQGKPAKGLYIYKGIKVSR